MTDSLISAERSLPTADPSWNEPSYDPLSRMHHFWLGMIVTGLLVLVAALAAAAHFVV